MFQSFHKANSFQFASNASLCLAYQNSVKTLFLLQVNRKLNSRRKRDVAAVDFSAELVNAEK
jgi:hypothetical protein